MSRANLVVVIVAIILIIVGVVVINRKNNTSENITNSIYFEGITYNTVTNETTGSKDYVVYDKESGKEITTVDNEHKLKIYELDPNYEEQPVYNESGEVNNDSSLVENE